MIWIKKLLIKMLTCAFESEELYSGNKKTGTFSLNGNPSDYDIIVVKSQTNVEYFADVLINCGITGNIKYDHEDGTGAYHSSLTIALGNNAMNATVNYNNVNWQLGVVQVIGIKIFGGGYFLALFSAIERWWSRVRSEETSEGNHSDHKLVQKQVGCNVRMVHDRLKFTYPFGGRLASVGCRIWSGVKNARLFRAIFVEHRHVLHLCRCEQEFLYRYTAKWCNVHNLAEDISTAALSIGGVA